MYVAGMRDVMIAKCILIQMEVMLQIQATVVHYIVIVQIDFLLSSTVIQHYSP